MKKSCITIMLLLIILLSACTTVEPSETTETTAAQISSLKMYITDAQEMTLGGLKYESWVKVEPTNFSADDIEFISMHPDTLSVEAGKVAVGGNLWFSVTAKKEGISGFYAQTKDGKLKSEVIKVTITK